MMVWLGIAGLSLVVIALILVRGRISDAAADPIALYKKQLADLRQDAETGVLEPDAAEAARLEIERRILRVTAPNTGAVVGENKLIPLVLAGLVVGSAFAFYYAVGNPTLPAAPGRMITVKDTLVEEGGPSFGEAIAQIESHLATNPDDVKGWEVLAKSARAVADYSRAATAFGRLADLSPEDTSLRAQELEAFIAMGAGQVSPAAKLVLQKLLDKAPQHPAGHYYLGLARQQAGDDAGARAIWLALADRSAASAPWMPVLNQRLSELGVNPPKLSDEQVSAVAGMSPEEREAFVQSMIERLEERLESAPDDSEGWMMLARSKLATGSKEDAVEALRRGIGHVGAEKAGELQAFLDNLLSNTDL